MGEAPSHAIEVVGNDEDGEREEEERDLPTGQHCCSRRRRRRCRLTCCRRHCEKEKRTTSGAKTAGWYTRVIAAPEKKPNLSLCGRDPGPMCLDIILIGSRHAEEEERSRTDDAVLSEGPAWTRFDKFASASFLLNRKYGLDAACWTDNKKRRSLRLSLTSNRSVPERPRPSTPFALITFSIIVRGTLLISHHHHQRRAGRKALTNKQFFSFQVPFFHNYSVAASEALSIQRLDPSCILLCSPTFRQSQHVVLVLVVDGRDGQIYWREDERYHGGDRSSRGQGASPAFTSSDQRQQTAEVVDSDDNSRMDSA